MIEAEPRSATRWELSPEGEEVLREGSPEVRLFRSLPEEGLPQAEALVGTGRPDRTGPGEPAAPRAPHGRCLPVETARGLFGVQQSHGQ